MFQLLLVRDSYKLVMFQPPQPGFKETRKYKQLCNFLEGFSRLEEH